jgi:predicted secreted acid phosphatase
MVYILNIGKPVKLFLVMQTKTKEEIMKTNLMKSVTLGLVAIASIGQAAFAKDYSPEALRGLIQRAEDSVRQGKQPLVMFDLDDTLTNTRERNLRILQDFAAQSDIQTVYPDDVAKIKLLKVSQIHYSLSDTLKAVGVINDELTKKANDFWLARFFTNEYCAKDQATPGAAKYLHLLSRAGAKIVYLTGRDIPRMGDGTQANLILNRFPTDPSQALLIMKPDPQLDDLKFKESQYASVASMGEVIGVFENEPANINSMADAFPEADAIFLDTIHSPKPDVPGDRVEWVKNFRLH